MSDNDIADHALFLKKGLFNTNIMVSSDVTPIARNADAGGNVYMNNCIHMCHGSLGRMINFGDSAKPEFVNTVANKNPWEFIHKVRAGQPGKRMLSVIINKWTNQDISDLLIFVRTLPTETPRISWFRQMMENMGFGRGHHECVMPEKHRGYDPTMEQLSME